MRSSARTWNLSNMRWLIILVSLLALPSHSGAMRRRSSFAEGGELVPVIPGRRRHEDRAAIALQAWFNGAASNFVLTERNIGATVTQIIEAVRDFDAAQPSASSHQETLDLNTRRVTTFLNEQSDERVTLVKDAPRAQKKTYQVVPPQVKTIPGDRHRNAATINRNKLR